MTIGFYTKSYFKMKLSLLFINLLILNFGPRILNPHTSGYPFPFAGHKYIDSIYVRIPYKSPISGLSRGLP